MPEDFRFGVVEGFADDVAADWFVIHSLKTLSAAASVGLARFAGVPVLDLARRVDFPKEPVSATARRDLVLLG